MHLVYIATCHPKIFFIPNRAYLIEKTVYVLDVFHIEIKAFERDLLRSLGFGKKSILLILFIQVMTVIVAECILGISFGALCYNTQKRIQ